ncbi:MAG: glycoside hydrolase family 3 N-terminal domain-containing protein [Polyangiales bacterium]
MKGPSRRRRLLAFASVVLGACTEAPAAPPADASVDRHVPAAFAPTAATRAYCPADDAVVEARVTSLLAGMTAAEKASLLHGASLAVVDGTWRVPGLDGRGVPGFRMTDGPRGVSALTTRTATVWPVPMMRGATWDPSLERRVGEALAVEARSVGADVLLAPTMNLLRHPRWGRAQETYSEDTHHLGAMAAAFIEGAQSRGVLATAKHYAANSIEATRHTVDVRVEPRALREVYLPHFRRAVVEARVAAVMSAYNQVDGAWADQSRPLLTDVLRGEWGFAGFVMSDWVFGTHGDVDSLRAGLDVEMPTGLRFRNLAAAVGDGRLAERELDESARRVLRAQLCYGLDARPVVRDAPTERLTPEHLALAREVARRGVVLLRNEAAGGAPALPFGPDVRSVVVAGRLADVDNLGDRGSSRVLPGEVVSALEGIRARPGVTVTHLRGATIDAAGEAAVRAADAVVVVTGNDADDEGEGEIGAGDRASLSLRAEEASLIERLASLHGRVVVVLEGGAAITAPWRGAVEALAFAFYPGAEGGAALAEVLFGDASPSGRLPFSIPAREEDLPPFDNTSPQVTYGYLHGYRHLSANNVAPAYAFGAGLSYTRFAWRDVAVDRAVLRAGESLAVSVTVANEGTVRARETVQVYVGVPGSRVTRAPRDLRGFAQVELAPGEVRRVTATVRADDLAYWDDARRWVLEPGAYEAIVARDAVDAGLRVSFRVE